ncbi:MAG TPA: DUF4097 family beta strand repeat-containing protein [Candidatus Limnocylindrales bacterium]|nr:DUF4097 family beta strand repeat-containing protein [Candidatus Limnocylindrales bacterium]
MSTRTDAPPFEHAIGPDGLVVVRLPSGGLRLRGTDGDRAVVRSRRGQGLDGLEVDAGERSLAIGTAGRHGGGRHGRSVDLDLDIPTGATVVVEAESADVLARDLSGDQRYRTASGEVTLRDVSGTIAVEAVSGDVEVVGRGAATMAVRTVSGDVSLLADALLGLELSTASGDIELAGRFEAEGRFQIETVSGDTRLSPANDVRLEMDTISGDLDSRLDGRREDSGGRRILVVGQGGPTIRLRSTSGDVRVDDERVVLQLRGRHPSPDIARTPPVPVRPAGPDLPAAVAGDDLDILRALERGEIDTAEARRRLAALDGSPLTMENDDV